MFGYSCGDLCGWWGDSVGVNVLIIGFSFCSCDHVLLWLCILIVCLYVVLVCFIGLLW